jgi:hypothetical protein
MMMRQPLTIIFAATSQSLITRAVAITNNDNTNPPKAPKASRPPNSQRSPFKFPSPDRDPPEVDWQPFPYYVASLIHPANTTTTSNQRGRSDPRQQSEEQPSYNCQQYPDYFSVVNSRLDVEYPINVTCWTTAPAMDRKVACEEAGMAWFKTADGCYVPDYIVETRVKVQEAGKRPQTVELVDMLRYCPQPLHQVGALKRQYQSTYCYGCASLECDSRSLGPQNGSVELECWKTGQIVRGNE